MKKLLFVLPLFMFLLSSCNFPLFKTKELTSSEIVNTWVAQTMQSKSTVLFVTATPLPLAETETPTTTATSTLIATPTQSPDDPKLKLGMPTFAETFSSGSSFGLMSPYTDDAITMSVENGALVMTSSKIDGGFRWRLTYLTPRNFYLEGTFKTTTCTGSDYYGLVMRAPSYTDGIGYYFGVSCDGKYDFFRYDGSEKHIISDWKQDPAIQPGENQVNRLGVMLTDSNISLYANGKLLTQLTDNIITQKGYFGVFQAAVESPNMSVSVEEIDEWNQP